MTETKGIWIYRELEIDQPLGYLTSLRTMELEQLGFIPFDHHYPERYLGSISFLDIGEVRPSYLRNIDSGLLQQHFYPLGGEPHSSRPLLLGNGLARKIEHIVAQDLQRNFALDTNIVIGATSTSHLEYCRKIGFPPFQAISLREYSEKLTRSIKN